ncbi:MAG: DUF2796 domain-containing protein [Alphaproteobacteria bacterium]
MKTKLFDSRNAAVTVAICALATIFVSPTSFAADRHHGAHQHGVSRLNLVVDGKRLEMELVSPGSDIVGFEHAPANDADRKAISKAVAHLKDGAALFVPSAAAGCKLQSAEIEAPGAEKKEEHHRHGRGHKHDHARENHDHHAAKAEKEAHSEFHAHYRYVCERPEKLTHIDAKFFDVFPSAKEIEVQAVTPGNQFRRELTAANPRLTL